MKQRMLLILLAVLVCLSGCGKTVSTGEDSPHLAQAAISTYNEGSVDSQFVEVSLTFDRAVSVPETPTDSLRITISGNRVRDYALKLGDTENTVLLTLPVESVTEGHLYIGRADNAGAISDILSADGVWAAEDFEIAGIIPSGVQLETKVSEPGRVVKTVTHGWNIRSIAWVGLYEDETLIPVSETRSGEELDGYAAVHGHEFLIEDEADIAEKIVEILEQNYDNAYRFSCDGTQVTAEKPGSDGALDVRIYQYLSIGGQRQEEIAASNTSETSETEPEAQEDHEDHEGLKYKTSQEDRTPTAEEQAFLALLRTARLSGSGVEDATDLFETLTLTGEAMPETQVYSIKDLEELLRLSFVNEKMNALGLPGSAEGYYGLDLAVLLTLCGVDTAEDLTLLCETADGSETALPLSLCVQENTICLLALSDDSGPLDTDGPICLVLIRDGGVETIPQLSRLVIGPGEVPADPGYGYHDHEPYLESETLAFTVEVYQAGAEYLGPLKSASFTTKELETLMQEHPETVCGGWYGTIGNEEFFQYVGVGGWLDHFEGLDLYWLLTRQVGVESLSGRAELYDRDGELYTQIDDLAYFAQAHETPEAYYVMTSEGLKITGMIPMLATVKNGAPVLPDHTHDVAGYIPYNTLNANLEELGISTEVGVIKNHNGPFIACLGNRDGFYGGTEVETGNNCVTMKLYLNANGS